MVKEIKDKTGHKSYFVSVIRWITIGFFGLMILSRLSNFNNSPLKAGISILLLIIGIFIMLPKFNKVISKFTSSKIKRWQKILYLVFILFFAIIIFPSNGDIPKEEIISSNLTKSALTSLDVVRLHAESGNYKTPEEQLTGGKNRADISSGALKEYYSSKADYQRDLNNINSKLLNLLARGENIYGVDFFKNLTETIELSQSFKREIEVLEIDMLEENKTNAAIQTKQRTVVTYKNEPKETISYNKYLLTNEEGVWRIYDIIDSEGKSFFEKYNLEEIKKEDTEHLSILTNYYNVLEKPILEIEQQKEEIRRLQNSLSSELQKVLPNQVISINLANYNNQTDKFVVEVTYLIGDVFLTDDYFVALENSADIYKTIFPLNSKIYQVQIIIKEDYIDNYGNKKQKILARTSMKREVYSKINWVGFDYSNLDEITSFSFYGDSFYRDLKDLSDSMSGWQSDFSDFGLSSYDSSFTDSCSSAKAQCSAGGSCDVYSLLKSQGIC